MLKLHDSLDQILAGFRAANLTGHIQQIRSHLSHVQPDRLADETLLAIAKRSWDAMEMAPYEWEIWTGTAAIPVFQASILFRDALGAYIKRPSFPKQLLEAATVVLKAAAKELIGKYNPIFGFAMVIAEVTTPHIERQINQMEQTVDMLDRTFLLDDTLSRGLEFLKYVEAALSVSERGVAETQERFNRSFSWLDGLLQVARKAS
jgi:hypothetical protein